MRVSLELYNGKKIIFNCDNLAFPNYRTVGVLFDRGKLKFSSYYRNTTTPKILEEKECNIILDYEHNFVSVDNLTIEVKDCIFTNFKINFSLEDDYFYLLCKIIENNLPIELNYQKIALIFLSRVKLFFKEIINDDSIPRPIVLTISNFLKLKFNCNLNLRLLKDGNITYEYKDINLCNWKMWFLLSDDEFRKEYDNLISRIIFEVRSKFLWNEEKIISVAYNYINEKNEEDESLPLLMLRAVLREYTLLKIRKCE